MVAADLQELFNEYVINKGFTGVTEITELAKPASAIKLNTTNLIFEEGVALQLPVKVKLNNVFSVANATSALLETDRPEPDDGYDEPAVAQQIDQRQRRQPGNPRRRRVVRLTGGALVDNSFADEEGANGCGGFLFSWAVDPLVNETGTPSKAGQTPRSSRATLKRPSRKP